MKNHTIRPMWKVHGLSTDWLIDWLIDYLLFYLPLKNFSLLWRHHHKLWKSAKSRPRVQVLWGGRHLYRATSAVTLGPRFFLSHPEENPTELPLTTRKGMQRTYYNPDCIEHRPTLWFCSPAQATITLWVKDSRMEHIKVNN
jgi:hypothetical protein